MSWMLLLSFRLLLPFPLLLAEFVIFLFYNEHLKSGVQEIDNQKSKGKIPSIFFVYNNINQHKKKTGHEFHSTGHHIAGNELLGLAHGRIAQHDIESEKGEEEKEKDNEGQGGRSVLRQHQGHEDGGDGHDDGKDKEPEDILRHLEILIHFLHGTFSFG
jgi:hypothetical protein